MRKRLFPQYQAGQPMTIDWKKQDARLSCCDCDLVHRFRFSVTGRMLTLRAYRDNRATGQLRRYRAKALDAALVNLELEKKAP